MKYLTSPFNRANPCDSAAAQLLKPSDEMTMSRVKTLQSLFKRYRRPGDIVFAWAVLILAAILLTQLFQQTAYKPGGELFTQPRF